MAFWRVQLWLVLGNTLGAVARAMHALQKAALGRAEGVLQAARSHRVPADAPPAETAHAQLLPAVDVEIRAFVGGQLAFGLRSLRPLRVRLQPPALSGRSWIARWDTDTLVASGAALAPEVAVEHLLRDTWRVWRGTQAPDAERWFSMTPGGLEYLQRVRAWLVEHFEEVP